jgi:hypothetical protein
MLVRTIALLNAKLLTPTVAATKQLNAAMVMNLRTAVSPGGIWAPIKRRYRKAARNAWSIDPVAMLPAVMIAVATSTS